MEGAFVIILGALSVVITACGDSVVVGFCSTSRFDEPRKISKSYKEIVSKVKFTSCDGNFNTIKSLKFNAPSEYYSHYSVTEIELLRHEGVLGVSYKKEYLFAAKDGELLIIEKSKHDYFHYDRENCLYRTREDGVVESVHKYWLDSKSEIYALEVVPEMKVVRERKKFWMKAMGYDTIIYNPKFESSYIYTKAEEDIISRYKMFKSEFNSNSSYRPYSGIKPVFRPVVDVEW